MSGNEDSGFPAPGSDLPGAPPPLRRPVTEADGTADAGPVAEASEGADHLPEPRTAEAQDVRGTALLSAIALAGVAAGLELARLLGKKHVQRQRKARSAGIPA